MTFLRQFWEILAGRRLLLGLSVASGLLFAAANLLPPLLIRELIRWITEGGGSEDELLLLSAFLLVVYLLRGLTRYGYGRFSHAAAYKVLHDLMVRVYRHVQSLPPPVLHAGTHGESDLALRQRHRGGGGLSSPTAFPRRPSPWLFPRR